MLSAVSRWRGSSDTCYLLSPGGCQSVRAARSVRAAGGRAVGAGRRLLVRLLRGAAARQGGPRGQTGSHHVLRWVAGTARSESMRSVTETALVTAP